MSKPLPPEQAIADMLRLTDPASSVPNVNSLWQMSKDMTAMKLNIKFFGYELAKALMASLPPRAVGGPFEIDMRSKPSTQLDLEADWTRHWSAELKHAHIIHRKIWEYAYVLQVLWQTGKMKPGMKGVGFGCGEEPMASYLAAKGCKVLVTDLPPDDRRAKGWTETKQHATLDKAFKGDLVDRATFNNNVSFRHVDMSDLPADLKDYDFCWSICAFEHLGSIDKGVAFIENVVDSLKPGGVSVHTTEFNFGNDKETIDNWPTVLFQQRHFETMARRLEKKGCRVLPLDFNVGSLPLDRFIDMPPFPHEASSAAMGHWSKDTMHIKLSVDGFPTTCFGIAAIKQ